MSYEISILPFEGTNKGDLGCLAQDLATIGIDASMLTEIAKGKTIPEAKAITNKDVAEALDGLPKNKLHCSNLGAQALHKAIEDYQSKQTGKGGGKK